MTAQPKVRANSHAFDASIGPLMTLAEREARPAVPAAVRLFGHERHGLCVAMDRQVVLDITFGGGKLLLCAVVADRQVRHDLGELTAKGRIVRICLICG
jgi:hypothetical protein